MAAPRKNATQSRSSTAPRLSVVPAAADVSSTVPDLPEGMLDETRQVWVALWAEPQAAALIGAQRTVALRWAEAFDQWRRSLEVVKSCPIVEGSTKQPVLNPLAAWVSSRELEMEKCERQLGIGLRNRSDLGIAAGQAKLTAAQLNAMARKESDGVTDSTASEADDEVLEGWETG